MGSTKMRTSKKYLNIILVFAMVVRPDIDDYLNIMVRNNYFVTLRTYASLNSLIIRN